jgi:hypothetical protein
MNESTGSMNANAEPHGAAVPAWEEIEEGRFQPRRICGSFPGRELG